MTSKVETHEKPIEIDDLDEAERWAEIVLALEEALVVWESGR